MTSYLSETILLDHYRDPQRLFEGSNTAIYRAQRRTDQAPVILKALRRLFPPPELVARIRKEFELMSLLSVSAVPKVYGFEVFGGNPVISMEDFGGISLRSYRHEKVLSTLDFLDIALRIGQALEQVHSKKVIHRDINPSNILINKDSRQIKITDFGIATRLLQQTHMPSQSFLRGTLAYISPEQTGRMNRPVDYRSDYYSLGVTLYELLTGRLPFETSDPLELVHNHIAVIPKAPHELDGSIPEQISRIVMKLLSKPAEERYQSLSGLEHDLANCYHQLAEKGRIYQIDIGAKDISSEFHLQQKLYGRNEELEVLFSAFNATCNGDQDLLLVSGSAGVGKSVLVNEIQRPVVEKRGYFITGKFDQFSKDLPYFAIAQALGDFVKQILGEKDDRIDEWRSVIQAGVGPNGQLLIDLVPDLALVIGAQPQMPELPPTEAQNRFRFTFGSLLRSLATQAHPFLIFLDDLQWADRPSLDLLESFIEDMDVPYVLIVGSYRDNEVGAAHPLAQMKERLSATGNVVRQLTVGPLHETHIIEMLRDSTKLNTNDVQEMASTTFEKTQGNPFFLNQFLLEACEAGAISFVSDRWSFDFAKLDKLSLTDNVLQLLLGKLERLPEATIDVLRQAACTGNRFNLQTLAKISGRSLSRTAKDLWPAMEERLLIPLDEGYSDASEFPDDESSISTSFDVHYRFLHDRIQQAAYSLIQVDARPRTHLDIGRILVSGPSEKEVSDRIFDILGHISLGISLIDDPHEKLKFAELNLAGGRKAKASAAYQPAHQYLENGISLLPMNSWSSHYDLTLALYEEAVEAAFLALQFDRMEELATIVLKNAHTLLDKVKTYIVQIQSLMARNLPIPAIHYALPVLSQLGVDFPKNPSNLDVILGLLKIKIKLSGKDTKMLLNLPEMKDAHMMAATKILQNVFSSAYFAMPTLYPLIMFKFIDISLRYGNSASSTIGYAAYGVVLTGILKDIDGGYQFGRLALDLVDRLDANEVRPKVIQVAEGFTTAWKVPYEEILDSFLVGFQTGLEVGDFEFAAYTAYMHCYFLFSMGGDLQRAKAELLKYQSIITRLKQKTPMYLQDMWLQMTLNLLGENSETTKLIGEYYDEREALPVHTENNDKIALYFYHCNKMMLGIVFRDYEQVIFHAPLAKTLLADGAALGSTNVPLYSYYDALVCAGLARRAKGWERWKLLRRAKKHLKSLKVWAERSPLYNASRYHLASAEVNAVQGNHALAQQSYSQAIDLAVERSCLSELALAAELAAGYYEGIQSFNMRTMLLREAYQAYKRWGALAKTKQLEENYPELTIMATGRHSMSELITISHTTTMSNAAALDLLSVTKASQAISGEIVIDRLLIQLMNIMAENAGAERSAITLLRHGRITLDAIKESSKGAARVLSSIPLDEVKSLPDRVIHFVQRTGETVLLGDASRDARFARDPYIQANKVKSLLCLPIERKGNVLGTLYFENNLSSHVFSPARLDLLKILATQAAISLENALFTDELEQKVRTRTRELDASLDVIRKDLAIARQIQLGILPKKNKSFKGLEIISMYSPMSEVGGDLYDIEEIRHGKIRVFIADATGHGIQAALVTMAIRSEYESIKRRIERPEDVLTTLNSIFLDEFRSLHSFFSCCILDIDLDQKIIQFASAGHPDQYIMRERTVMPLVHTGKIAGFLTDAKYTSVQLNLMRGDRIYLFSDGVYEQFDPHYNQFGEQRMMDIFLENRDERLGVGVEEHLRQLEAFLSNHPKHDDLTLIAIEVC